MSSMKTTAKKTTNIADQIQAQNDMEYIVAFGDGV
jgi:hypothetical protein